MQRTPIPETGGTGPDAGGAGRYLRLLQTFWGLAVVVALGLFTGYDIAAPDGSDSTTPSRAESAALSTPAPTATASTAAISAPAGQFNVYLGCDHQDARNAAVYLPPQGEYRHLSLNENPDAVVQFLDGNSPDIPADAYVVETACFRQRLAEGLGP